MVNRIIGLRRFSPPGAVQETRPSQACVRPSKQDSGANITDSISITDTALSLTRAERNFQQQPLMDADKVDAIRISIADGKYHTDSRSIARNFIRFEFAYLGAQGNGVQRYTA